MEKKNKKMLLIVGVLLLLGGVTFAYFVGSSMFGGTGATVEGITASINGAELKIEGNLEFNDLDILPGHKNISSIKVTATGNNELIPYNLIWKGTNSLNTPLEFTVYKTSNEIETSTTCEKKSKIENGAQILNEECTITNEDKLGSIISSGTINKSEEETKEILVSEEFITATSDGMSVYYYIILEYPNLDEDQNIDMGGNFNGTVTVEESNAKPDINILAVKIEQEDGTYQDSEDIPQSGYYFDEEKSVCNNEAKVRWDFINKELITSNLTKSGTSCYLYFNRGVSTTILANVTVNEGSPDFSKIATTDEGVFRAKDDDGDTYYWRGAVTNNYVMFAGFYWRIIRINGDGTIRIIYEGLNSHSNGTVTNDSIAVANQSFNLNYNNSIYVGFKYTSNHEHGTETKSNALEQLETWYKNNLTSYDSKIDKNAGFCGDRTYTTNGSNINYQSYNRLNNNITKKSPVLICSTDDFYTTDISLKGNKSLDKPIGLITADEVSMAGGVEGWSNSDYFLYNGHPFWTMSPRLYYYNSEQAPIYSVYHNGNLCAPYKKDETGLRPVINLRADTKFTFNGTGEKGSMTNPYIVE